MDRDSEVKIEKRDNNGRQREKLSDGETERERYSSKDNSLQDKAGYKKGRSKALKKKKKKDASLPIPALLNPTEGGLQGQAGGDAPPTLTSF